MTPEEARGHKPTVLLSMRKISWFGSLIMKNTDIWKTKPVIPPKMEHLAVDR